MQNLKIISAKFYEVSVAVREAQSDGTEKIVKHAVAVDALSFGEAESIAIAELQPEEVININPAQYKEVCISQETEDEKYYKCKLEFITMDEKTMKEKRSTTVYLVQAKSLNRALRYLDDMMAQSTLDYNSVGVVGTNITDIILHEDKDKVQSR